MFNVNNTTLINFLEQIIEKQADIIKEKNKTIARLYMNNGKMKKKMETRLVVAPPDFSGLRSKYDEVSSKWK